MKKPLAEFIGTFALIFFGCSAIVTAGPAVGTTTIGMLGISLAFGLTIVAMAFALGPVSGGHFNPAVSLGVLVAGRMTSSEFVQYVVAQALGAFAGALLLWLILSGRDGGAGNGLGATTFGGGGGFAVTSAFLFEGFATFLFVLTILGATAAKGGTPMAGLIIGLTLVAIHLAGINISGASVNPARSLGPALLVGGTALAQVWLYILAPLIGGAAAGALVKSGLVSATS